MTIKTEIGQFLALQQKSIQELRALCAKMQLASDGSQADLVDRIMGYEAAAQVPDILPQALPLRTIDDSGKQMPEAVETLKRWRKLIYEARGNQKDFNLVNSQGKQYKARLRYVRCSQETLKGIIERRWYFAHESQQPLVNALRERPEDFDVNIIQKPSGKGNSWIMLHAEEKAA